VVEAILIRHDPDMAEAIEEYERSELISCITFDWLRDGPEASYILPFEIDSSLIKDAPYKA
jgi:hypothetical protein